MLSLLRADSPLPLTWDVLFGCPLIAIKCIAHLSLVLRGGGRLRLEGRTLEDTVVPVEGLGDEGHALRPPSSEEDGLHLDALGVLPVLVQDGAVGGRRAEAGVGVGGLATAVGAPVLAQPVDQVGRSLLEFSTSKSRCVFMATITLERR